MTGEYPADHSNRQPGAFKNLQFRSTASILATEPRGCEPTGDAPGDFVFTKSKQLLILLLEGRIGGAIEARLHYSRSIRAYL
jgi:hypothetical protein